MLRAALAHSESAGSNEDLLIADEVLFGIGFFGLLYSAYTLVLDRWVFTSNKSRARCIKSSTLRIELSNMPLPQNIISRFTQNRHLFRVTLSIAIVLGIIGITKSTSSDASSRSTGSTLHKASTIMFLVLTILQAYQTVLFTMSNNIGAVP